MNNIRYADLAGDSLPSLNKHKLYKPFFVYLGNYLIHKKKSQEYCILIIQKTTSDDSVIPVRFSGDKL